MSRIASLRAEVTSFSFSSIARCRTGGSGFSSVAASSAGLASGLAAKVLVARNNKHTIRALVALFVVRVLIRPVLALERPVLLVVAHQAFELELGEHVRWIAALPQVGDLDLELLLLADDRVDLGEPRLAQQLAQPPVQLDERLLGDGARGGHQAGAQASRLGGQPLRLLRLARERAARADRARRPPHGPEEIAHPVLHVRVAL